MDDKVLLVCAFKPFLAASRLQHDSLAHSTSLCQSRTKESNLATLYSLPIQKEGNWVEILVSSLQKEPLYVDSTGKSVGRIPTCSVYNYLCNVKRIC